MTEKYRAIGLMSGTSIDGIDLALIETDGFSHVLVKGGESYAYDKVFREQVRASFEKKGNRGDPHVAWVENELTKRHAYAVKSFMDKQGLSASDVDLIGFHGQTIWHDPKNGVTVQLGDGQLLAELTGINVVNDFRTADVKAGGQGAPLVPLYHQALCQALPKPVVIVNIGGVSNLTWIAEDGLLAFDTGPGNAMIDDWMMKQAEQPCDKDGAQAASGTVRESHIQLFLHHPYFEVMPPKSLDRNAFMNFVPSGVNLADGAATLTMMTVRAIVEGIGRTPTQPAHIYVAGGGRHNKTMMRWLAEFSGAPVSSVDELDWKGDFLEAEAFAYLAVRSLLGLPLSLPTTTGVDKPMTGGRLHKVNKVTK